MDVKGLRANIYKRGGQSFSNGGISETAEEVTVVGIFAERRDVNPVMREAQVTAPTKDAPPVALKFRHLGGGVYPQAVPAVVTADGEIELERRDDSVGPMMGGCFIGTDDGRFSDLIGMPYTGPIALHDRFETTKQYASYD